MGALKGPALHNEYLRRQMLPVRGGRITRIVLAYHARNGNQTRDSQVKLEEFNG